MASMTAPAGVAHPYAERAVSFRCGADTLVGVVAAPAAPTTASPATNPTIGVVVVVGGPQYRAGSHRQFVLLSRALAQAGHAVLRFDYRGMGDSSGMQRDFLDVSDDIAAAIDALQRLHPSVTQVALWGLCDGASAALLYCHATRDPRVRGLCLVNPWVRSDATLAKTQVKHYYAQRLKEKEFWRKLLSGKVAGEALTGLARNLKLALFPGGNATAASQLPFQARMARAWQDVDAPILLFLSGNDYTAKEFQEYVAADPAWAGALRKGQLLRHEEKGADHTLSQRSASDAAVQHTLALLARMAAAHTDAAT